MTWRHLTAFVWLRWRLLVNQWRRAGALNAALMVVLAVGAVVTAVPLFVGAYLLGAYAIPKATPEQLMYAWDALAGAFLVFWLAGLLTELQRSDPLSLSKFLHLPVSPNGAFLINYLSSLLRLSVIVFVPPMVAYCLALVTTLGISQWPALPLLGAFLLMVTALTYQLQGWLAVLMSNPRRRRTLVMVMTVSFVLIFQLLQMLHFVGPLGRAGRVAGAAARAARLDGASAARLANTVLPVGWLPLGVMTAAEGRVVPSLLGLAGMTLIGTVSLWRAYETTVGQFRRRDDGRRARRAPAPAPAAPAAAAPRARRAGTPLLEARLPGVSEPVSAVALAGFRALVRAPEAKMMLLSPVITGVIFGSMLWRSRDSIPEAARPLVAVGGVVFALFGVLQVMGNQFGFDRDGFRVFVLCAAPRRDILLGKNLAFAPVTLGLFVVYLVVVQVVCPLRPDHALAMIPQFVSMYLLFCLFTNMLSIVTPAQMAPGTLKPSNMTAVGGFIQVGMFVVLFPLTQLPTLLPLGAEAGLSLLGRTAGLPVYLLLSLAECAAIVVVYRLLIAWQGDLLQQREQAILERVTNKGP